MTPIQASPRFVVVEGLDGAGTTTQSRRLAQALQAADLRVCLTAEPSDGPVGTVLRSHLRREITLDPTSTALAFCADRADHLARVVRPALADGRWVVCDRYLLSTLAYQGAEGVNREWILQCSAGVDVPDLTILLDVDDAAQSARLGGREALERYEDPADQSALRGAYEVSAAMLAAAGHRIERIDGTRPVEAVARAIAGLAGAMTDPPLRLAT